MELSTEYCDIFHATMMELRSKFGKKDQILNENGCLLVDGVQNVQCVVTYVHQKEINFFR